MAESSTISTEQVQMLRERIHNIVSRRLLPPQLAAVISSPSFLCKMASCSKPATEKVFGCLEEICRLNISVRQLSDLIAKPLLVLSTSLASTKCDSCSILEYGSST